MWPTFILKKIHVFWYNSDTCFVFIDAVFILVIE